MLYRQTLRYKINITVGLVLLSVTLVFGAALAAYETHRRNTAIQQIKLSLNGLTLQYRKQLGNEIFASQIMAIEATMTDVMKSKNVICITAYDEFGSILVSTDKSMKENLSKDQMAALAFTPDTVSQKWNGRSVLSFTSPIQVYGEKVGYWQIQYSLTTLEQETMNIVLIFVTLIITIGTLIGFLLNSILVRFILNPVYMLKNAMQNIQGNDNQADPKLGSPVGHQTLDKMVQAFDELPDDLIRSQATDNEINSLAYSFRQLLFALKNAYIGIRTDALTGMNNRRKLDEAMENEASRSKRYQSIFSIIMLDIDHFKKANDIYGHLAGDEVLKKMAGLLQKTFRETDIPGRWGGEEFLILLPQQNSKNACMIAEKLRAEIESTRFPVAGNITASFGVAEYKPDDTPNDLIKRADDALYKAKAQGRNRVEKGR